MKNLLILSFLLLASPILAQPEIAWDQTYGSEGNDVCYSVITTPGGGFAMAGRSTSFGEGDQDFLIIVTNSAGETIRAQNYGGAGEDACYSIISTSDGGYALAGETTSFGEGATDFWLVVIDEEGEEVFSQSYGGENADVCQSVIQTSDGGFLLSGQTESFGEGSSDFYLVKVDENGEVEWTQTYGGEETDSGRNVLQTGDGGFIIAGTTESSGAGASDFWLIKTDEAGDVEWSQTYGGEGYETCGSLISLDSGGYAIGGYTNSWGEGGSDYYLVVTDEDGEEQWSQTYGGSRNDECVSITSTIDNGFIMVGTTRSFNASGYDILAVKTDEEGNSQWMTLFGGDGVNRGHDVMQMDDGGIIIAGYAPDARRASDDFWLIKTTPDPAIGLIWWPRFPPVDLPEDEDLTLSLVSLRSRIIAPGISPEDIEIEMVDCEIFTGEIENDTLFIHPQPDWNGTDSLRLVVSAPEQTNDTTCVVITVQSLNDLPDQFSLLNPQDDFCIESWITSFEWEEATQNQWEADSVSYSINFRCLSLGWENNYVIVDYPDTTYPDVTMATLAEGLELELGEAEFEIEWWVVAYDDSGSVESNEHLRFFIPVMDVKQGDYYSAPGEFSLHQGNPNPFNATTKISYSVPYRSLVRIAILDISGHFIGELTNGYSDPGKHVITWNAASLPAGVYFCRMEADGYANTRKLVLIK